MADDLSLIFRVRGDASGAKQATAETRAAVAQLRSSLGPEFNAMQSAGQKALAGIGDSVNTFVGARVPLIGGAFLRVSENLGRVGTESKKVDADLAKFGKTIDGLSTSTGKSKSQLVSFLTSFVQLETQAKRDTAVIETFGAAAAQKLIPQLEKAGTELSTVAANAGAMGSSLAAVAPQIAIAVVAALALTAAAALITQKFIELTVSTAAWQGKLYDTSQQTEVSVETLSGLEVALRKAGGELGSATNAIITFQTKLADAQDPMSDTAARFEALGITATDTEGAFRQALAAVAAMPDGFEKVNTAAELFGRRGAKQLLAAIKETGGDLDKLIGQLKATGVLLEGDVARAADEFNDQLLMVQLQVRALTAELVTDSIPQILAALRGTSKLISENRGSIELVGKAIGVFVEGNIRGILLPALQLTALAVKSIEKAWDGVQLAALLASGMSAEAAAEIVRTSKEAAKGFDKGGEEDSGLGGSDPAARRLVKESQEQLKQLQFVAAERSRVSKVAIAQAERDYHAGKLTAEQRSKAVIGEIKKETAARLEALQADEILKQRQIDAAAGDVVKQRKLAEEIDKIRQDSRNLQSDTNTKIANDEANAAKNLRDQRVAAIQDRLALTLTANNAELKAIQDRIKNHEVSELKGAEQIERIENESLEARRQAITQEQRLHAVRSEEYKRLLRQRRELTIEATETERQQAERRKQIARDEFEHERSLLLARLDTQLRLGTISDNAQIASLRALAALRIRTEEETERAILAIRLADLDRQAEAVRAKLTAAGSISDPKARATEEQRFNDELKIILAETTAVVDQGARDVDGGRQRDLNSLRKYRDAYRDLLEEVAEDERDIAKLRIEMLITSRASRLTILQAEFEEETAHANRRHARELKRLREDYEAAKESAKGMQEKLAALQAYNLAVEAENERHELAEKERKERERQEQLMAGPFGGLFSGLETGQLTELQNGIESFRDMAIVAFSAVGAAVNGLAQGIGSLVQNWVLMGSTGPNAMRKMVASVLAGVAAQAAVLAIFELAKGFAMLFFNPAEAAAHFYAAALFGSLAVGTAVAGRAVAGNAFQQTASGSGGGTSGGSRSSSTPTRNNEPVDIDRRGGYTPVVNVTITGQATEGFKYMVEKVAVQSVRENGPFRKIQTGEDV